VLYDVVGDSYLGVDTQVLEAIGRWPEAPPQDEREAAWVKSLAELGFLVEDAAADDRRLAESLGASSEGMPGTVFVTLMPTLACNLACSYCFQKHHPATGKMSGETEQVTIDWILGKVDEARAAKLLVCYFGGEPLTRKDFVLRTAETFAREMAQRGGVFEWQVITNGVELDLPFARALSGLGHGEIKITLDGDQETHDAARVYRDGRGTFERSFEALVEVARACPEIDLRLGGNFRAGQEGSYERLMRKLEVAGVADRITHINFKPIVDPDDGERSGQCGGGCGTSKAEAETLVQIGKVLARSRPKPTSEVQSDQVGVCELHWKRSWAIDPMGRVYKCPAVAGKPEMAIGKVQDQALGADPLTGSRPWERHAPCRTCAFLPVCMGGCLAGSYLQSGKTGGVFCQVEQFERVFRADVLRRYLDEFPEEGGRDAA
jgi:uncharacterized protein